MNIRVCIYIYIYVLMYIYIYICMYMGFCFGHCEGPGKDRDHQVLLADLLRLLEAYLGSLGDVHWEHWISQGRSQVGR